MQRTELVPTKTPRGVSFRQVAFGFFALLAIGLALGFVVYEKFVAYEPAVAGHIPPDATLAARIDLTHVTLYEPARRAFLPLVERGAPAGVNRAQALTDGGVRLGADVRELALALGPGDGDWLLLAGGKLPKTGIAELLAGILQREQRPSATREGGVRVLGDGTSFAQAPDGSFILASSEARLRSALPVHEPDLRLTGGAGGVVASLAALGGGPWQAFQATWRAGSYLSVTGTATFADAASGPMLFRAGLDRVASIDPALAAPLRAAEVRPSGREVSFRAELPREAVEALARWLATRGEAAGWAAAN